MLRRPLSILGLFVLAITAGRAFGYVQEQWKSDEQYAVWSDYLNQAFYGDYHVIPAKALVILIDEKHRRFGLMG